MYSLALKLSILTAFTPCIVNSTLFYMAPNLQPKSLKSAITNLIIGGYNSPVRPFFIRVNIIKQSYFCGGALIDFWWVITSAQCVYRIESKNYYFVLLIEPFKCVFQNARAQQSQIFRVPDFNYIQCQIKKNRKNRISSKVQGLRN